MKVHLNILVTGKVQGVFYRASTHEVAQQLGVTGFVQNLPDGNVYVEAEGEEEVLLQLVTWCRQGPPLAGVTNVTVTPGPVQHFHNFSIKR